jgi:hypothetical protein
MDKYTLLLILNLPFVVFGIIRTLISYKQANLGRLAFSIRFCFWLLILLGLFFSEEIYSFLIQNNLTDSGPLSLPDVIMITGIIFLLFLSVRLYARNEALENKLTDLHESISIEISAIKKTTD